MDGLVHSIGGLPDNGKKHVSPDLLVQSIAQGISKAADPDLETVIQQLADEIEALKDRLDNQEVYVTPPGIIAAWSHYRSDIPNGWLYCDGSAISRTEYEELYSVIGGAYGSGNGSTTFNLPDLRGRFLFGWADGYPSLGSAGGGEASHTLTTAEMPAHRHLIGIKTTVSEGSGYGLTQTAAFGNRVMVSNGETYTNILGSTAAHNNMPPYKTVHWMISTGKPNSLQVVPTIDLVQLQNDIEDLKKTKTDKMTAATYTSVGLNQNVSHRIQVRSVNANMDNTLFVNDTGIGVYDNKQEKMTNFVKFTS